MTLPRSALAAIDGLVPKGVNIENIKLCGGGSIARAVVVRLSNRNQLFVKTLDRADDYAGMFEAELMALERLRATNVIDVPRPIAAGSDYLIAEAFSERPRHDHWQSQLGRSLALMHEKTQTSRTGFDVDNYIGTTPQNNRRTDDWVSFWRERRLFSQLERLGLNLDDPLRKKACALGERLDEILGETSEPNVLLHGDLWSGNAAANERGEPVIFDPASYYGQREAEFGIMQMFGGFDEECYNAYNEVWPLLADSARRIAIYRLYHEMNHLIIFGGAYYNSALKTLQSIL